MIFFFLIRLPSRYAFGSFVGLVNLRAALIYDAVMVFAMAIKELGREQVLPMKIMCDDPTTTWNKGNTILNFMKKVTPNSIHFNVKFYPIYSQFDGR